MIAGEKLKAWLLDKQEQARSSANVHDFAREWSQSDLMTSMKRELSLLQERTPQSVMAIARQFMDRAEDISSIMAAMHERSRGDPYFLPPFLPLSSEIHSGLLLFQDEELSIGMGITGIDMLAAKKAFRKGPASIGFTGVWTLFRYLKAGNATVSFWEAPRIEADFSAANAGQCRCTGRRRLKDGEEILIDGSRESFIVEHADGDILYLQAMVRTGSAPLTAEYDSETRRFMGATSTDEASSRLQMMASLLRAMEREDAIPVLRQSLASPHFYTRWHVMRELLALDAEAVLPDLKQMAAHDPHPEVRAAASQTLELFFAEEGAQEEAVACRA